MANTMKVLNGSTGGDNSQRRTIVQGTMTLSGSYATGGETISWTGLVSADYANVLIPTTDSAPVWTEFYIGIPGTTAVLWLLAYNYSTGKLQIYGQAESGTTNGFAEYTAGTYNADLTSATIYWKAEFQFAD